MRGGASLLLFIMVSLITQTNIKYKIQTCGVPPSCPQNYGFYSPPNPTNHISNFSKYLFCIFIPITFIFIYFFFLSL